MDCCACPIENILPPKTIDFYSIKALDVAKNYVNVEKFF